jgi:hypothetical protein
MSRGLGLLENLEKLFGDAPARARRHRAGSFFAAMRAACGKSLCEKPVAV